MVIWMYWFGTLAWSCYSCTSTDNVCMIRARAEVCQMCFFFGQKAVLVPASCIDKIKSVFKAVAKWVVDLGENSATAMKILAKAIIGSDSSSQVAMIPGRILLSFVSFLILSQSSSSKDVRKLNIMIRRGVPGSGTGARISPSTIFFSPRRGKHILSASAWPGWYSRRP